MRKTRETIICLWLFIAFLDMTRFEAYMYVFLAQFFVSYGTICNKTISQ